MATAAVLKVYARQALVDTHLRADEPALLLEGSWPHADSPLRRSLDGFIDARHAWIDDEASRLAQALASADIEGDRDACWHEHRTFNVQRPTSNERVATSSLLDVGRWTLGVGRSIARCPGPAYLNELKLRYHLVKLLRVVAFFDMGQTFLSAGQAGKPALPVPHGGIELVAARQRDEDYAEILATIAMARRWQLVVTRRDEGKRDACEMRFPLVPPNHWWRRAAAVISSWTNSSWTNPSWQADDSPRIVLCGSRRVLAGVCDELVGRGARVAWLYDRFALQTWLRWRWAGVAQLVCNASINSARSRTDCQSLLPGAAHQLLAGSLSSRGIDVSAPIVRWLRNIQQQHGTRQAKLWRSIDAHFARLRPTALVLDEDATPMARAAVAAARRHGLPSVVVQHGVPRVKFGFAPLAADHFFAWGAASRRQLLRWGVPLERIRVTGWPDATNRTSNVQRPTSNVEQRGNTGSRRSDRPEILLFATTPPRDDRPDAVTFHLTERTHRQMLWMACAAVASIPGAWLTIKLHPRGRDAALFRAAAAEFPHLRCRVVRRGNIPRLVQRASCVLNCTSSAGIEASLLGARVIELIPEGSLDLLPAREWNALGAARTEPELRRLLHAALNDDYATDLPAPSGAHSHVFAAVGQDAARRVVDELLTIVPVRTEGEVPMIPSSSSSSSSEGVRGRGRRRGRGRKAVSPAHNQDL